MENDFTPQKSKKKRQREKDKQSVKEPTEMVGSLQIDAKAQKAQTLDVKVQVVCDQLDKTPPVIGYFPSGYSPYNSGSDGFAAEGLSSVPAGPSVRLYRNAQRVKIGNGEKVRGAERMELVVCPGSGTSVEFVGKSYKGEALAPQLCTYALGVLDKETKTLKVVPIAGNKIFRLEPRVPRPDSADKEPSILENAELPQVRKADQMKRLTHSFGSKKSINQDKKANALKQGENPLSQQDLERKIENSLVNKEALQSTSAEVARNIPPHNSSANSPKEAYPLDRIIHTVEWDYIGDIYRILQKGAEVAREAYPVFVCNRIQKLRETQDEEEKQTLAGVLSYISHLVNFKDRFSADGHSTTKSHRIPDVLHQRFLGMFNPSSKWLSDEKRDLLISYVLVLTLHADDFRTNPADIAKDLRINPVDLKKHFMNLGCKFDYDKIKKSSSAILPAPLQFPVLRQKRRRRP